MIRRANIDDIPAIQEIAYQTWPATYGGIISEEQIRYMLDLMYSIESLVQQMTKGHSFFLMESDNTIKNEQGENIKATDMQTLLGFASVSDEGNGVFKLNKLYVLPSTHKTGVGKALLKTAKEYAKNNGGKELILQVNKKNPAIGFYQKQGLTIIRESIFELDHGFVMDDYIMGISLS